VRTARNILQGELHLPDYVFSKPVGEASSSNAPIASPGAAFPSVAAFPSRTITIIVPTTAGGANDAMARAIAQKLGPLLGRNVIVDNRAGANGSIAAEYVARAVPDGHTLMLGYIATHGMNPALQKLRYDPVGDFAPVGIVGYSPTLMVAGVAVPGQDVSKGAEMERLAVGDDAVEVEDDGAEHYFFIRSPARMGMSSRFSRGG